MKKMTAKEVFLTDGKVMDNCPQHTKDEWLEILQEKSRAQGKAISWIQIKNDPELDHRAIFDLLGPYVRYERDLVPRKVESKVEPPKVVIERPKAKAKPKAKVQEPTAKEPKPEPARAKIKSEDLRKTNAGEEHLGRITSPMKPWEQRGIVLVSKIRDSGDEGHIDLSQLEIIRHDPKFSTQDLQRLFAGLGTEYCLQEVTLSEEKISAKVRWQYLLEEERDPVVEFRVLPRQKVRLFIGLTMVLGNDCQTYDYIICDCEGLETTQKVKIVESEYYYSTKQ